MPSRLRRSLFCVLVASSTAACEPGETDPPQGETDGEDESEGSGDEAPTTDDPTEGDTTGDDPTGVDTTGDDPTGDDPTGDDPTGDDPTGEDTVPLGDDVLFFVRATGPSVDELWMYDVGTDTSARVVDLADAEVTSIAIAPARNAIAFATTYETVDYQESESIWALVNGSSGLGELTKVMPAIPRPSGVGSEYRQRIDDLSWHPDGSAIWFSHAIQLSISQSGGSALGRADVATGDFELFIDEIDGCAVNTGTSIAPDGSVLLAVRDLCTDDADAGVVAYTLPITQPQVLVPTGAPVYASPRWVTDGSGIAYAAAVDYDSDGDGTNDVYGDAILLLDTTSGESYVVLAPSPDMYIWSFALAPDAMRFVACVNQAGARNLLLVDYSGNEPTTRWLTDDGSSCEPNW